MQIKNDIEELLKKSLNVSFIEEHIKGSIVLENLVDVNLIERFESGIHTTITFQTPALIYKVGDTISFNLSFLYIENHYASYQNFIKHNLDISNSLPDIKNLIIYEDLYKVNQDQSYISLKKSLYSIINFIVCLSTKYYNRDHQIIIFSKNHCEIPIQPNNYEKYLELSQKYTTNQSIQNSLNKFHLWLNTTSNSDDDNIKKSLAVHEIERYAIAASEFIDNLITYNKNDRIFNLLSNIDIIYQSTLAKYNLYLDDFKYSKFNDKISKYVDEFLIKVNKIIADLQTQILAIPMAAAVLATFKPDTSLNLFIYLAFLIYSIMVFYATSQQTYNLVQVKEQIKTFVSDNKIPRDLEEKWSKEILPIKKKIFWHYIYIIFIFLFIIGVIFVCTLKLSSNTISEYLGNYLYNFINN